MTSISLKHDPTSWLLEPSSPGVRYLALRDLEMLPESNPELSMARQAAHHEGPIAKILAKISDEGYWLKPGPGYNGKYKSTVWSIIYLAQLGASIQEDERIARGCAYLLDHTLTPKGQFTYSGAPSGTFDCLQGNLCWALTTLGVQDDRLEQAYDWLVCSNTGEGVAPKTDKQATLRFYASKCGPNFACGLNGDIPCAWGAVKIMMAMGRVPEAKRTPAMQQVVEKGVQFLLSVDPAVSDYPLAPNIYQSQHWQQFAFPIFYIADFLQTLEALVDLGYGDDPRLTHAIEQILAKQNENGRWIMEYGYSSRTWASCGSIGSENKWVTLRAMRLLKKLQSQKKD